MGASGGWRSRGARHVYTWRRTLVPRGGARVRYLPQGRGAGTPAQSLGRRMAVAYGRYTHRGSTYGVVVDHLQAYGRRGEDQV